MANESPIERRRPGPRNKRAMPMSKQELEQLFARMKAGEHVELDLYDLTEGAEDLLMLSGAYEGLLELIEQSDSVYIKGAVDILGVPLTHVARKRGKPQAQGRSFTKKVEFAHQLTPSLDASLLNNLDALARIYSASHNPFLLSFAKNPSVVTAVETMIGWTPGVTSSVMTKLRLAVGATSWMLMRHYKGEDYPAENPRESMIVSEGYWTLLDRVAPVSDNEYVRHAADFVGVLITHVAQKAGRCDVRGKPFAEIVEIAHELTPALDASLLDKLDALADIHNAAGQSHWMSVEQDSAVLAAVNRLRSWPEQLNPPGSDKLRFGARATCWLLGKVLAQ